MYPSGSRKDSDRNGKRPMDERNADNFDSNRNGKRPMDEPDADNLQGNLTPAARTQAETWFLEEIQGLIDFRTQLDSQFNTAKSNKQLWQSISAEMRERGCNWSPSMCAERWGKLLTDFYNMKRQSGNDGTASVSYEEMVAYFMGREKVAAQKRPLIPEAHSASNFHETGHEQSAVNPPRGLDHDQHLLGINETDVVANRVSTWHRKGGAHAASYAGRVVTIRWGDCVKRIGVDGSPEAIKEVIKSAFGLRTRRPFWLEDDDGIIRSIDRNMPLRNYTLHLDEGLTIKIHLENAADESPIQAEEITFYVEDDFCDFLRCYGFVALTDVSCCKNVYSIGNLHPGEIYEGYRAPAN